RDGGLGGPDLDLLRRAVDASPARVIASGGISSIADLEAVRSLGCTAAIVGRALYEERLDLRAAISAVDEA
ncbi:MAG: HisA/HisF-related TIM barrel protein, partial [Candidatus Limnocylindrales bacterium]